MVTTHQINEQGCGLVSEWHYLTAKSICIGSRADILLFVYADLLISVKF